jgi:ferredoxin hydrogenase large subunit/hydrogenase large subunit
MARIIHIDPVTRIEGHLAIDITVQNGKVTEAKSKGEMFRGFENILKGRHPLDAQQITQRICGVCPISHGMSSVLAQDMAYGIALNDNGRLTRNLIQAANLLQSHIIHFYHLSALDFVDIAAITEYKGKDPVLNGLKTWVKQQIGSNVLLPAAPFLPRYEGKYIADTELNIAAIKHYLDALDMRALAQKMGAQFCAKMPHATGLVPGGITDQVTSKKIAACKSMLRKLRNFVELCYIPDVIAVAQQFPEYFIIGRGCKNFLAFGVYPESGSANSQLFPAGTIIKDRFSNMQPSLITENSHYSFFSDRGSLHPSRSETTAAPDKNGAYSWVKAPRYNGEAMEVGPLARILVAYHHPQANPEIRNTVNKLLQDLSLTPEALYSTLGRHAARALECKFIIEACERWLEQLSPDQPCAVDFKIPQKATGVGLTEAPRGALGHWLEIEDQKISRYQCIVPTTWNCSPMCEKNIPGPVEQALKDIPIHDEKHPIEATRVVRSFDPCLACAIH